MLKKISLTVTKPITIKALTQIFFFLGSINLDLIKPSYHRTWIFYRLWMFPCWLVIRSNTYGSKSWLSFRKYCSLDLILDWTFYILFCNYFGHSLGGVIIWTQILVASHARLWIGTTFTNYPVQVEIGDGFSTANVFHDSVLWVW